MVKPFTAPPVSINPGITFPAFGQISAGGVADNINGDAYVLSVVSAILSDPLPLQPLRNDFTIPNWGGDQNVVAGSGFTLAVETYGTQNIRRRVYMTGPTFLSANITDPQTITHLLLSTGTAGGDEVEVLIPLLTPWVVTANGQSLDGNLYYYPDSGLWEFFRET